MTNLFVQNEKLLEMDFWCGMRPAYQRRTWTIGTCIDSSICVLVGGVEGRPGAIAVA